LTILDGLSGLEVVGADVGMFSPLSGAFVVANAWV